MGLQITDRIKKLIEQISYQVYEKEEIFRLAMLALLAEESIFLLGKPGIAKSLISRRLKFTIKNGKNFEYLMSKFSTPEEIYGPIDLKQLKDGKYVRVVDGYLPDCNVGFLDEIWKAGPSIQNTLLTIINEKLFRNGGKDIKVPLKLLISASNELPAEGEGLEALFDRFIIRYVAQPLTKQENFEQLMDGESSLDAVVDPELQISTEELERWKKERNKIKISKVVMEFIHYFRQKVVRDTNGEAYISDRKWKKISGLMKTSAQFNGRMEADLPDMFIIPFCIWDKEEEEEKYRKIFLEAFLERFGLQWRQEKNNLLNELEVVNAKIGQIEAQYLRLTPYENPFKGKLPGTYYLINFVDGSAEQKLCFISAGDWNRLYQLSGEEMEIDLYFAPNLNKLTGKSPQTVKAYKADQILFTNLNKKYQIQNDSSDEYNRQMETLNEEILSIESKVKLVTKQMVQEYKKYTNQDCIFFEDMYYEIIAEAFDTKTKKQLELDKLGASVSEQAIESNNDFAQEAIEFDEDEFMKNIN